MMDNTTGPTGAGVKLPPVCTPTRAPRTLKNGQHLPSPTLEPFEVVEADRAAPYQYQRKGQNARPASTSLRGFRFTLLLWPFVLFWLLWLRL